MLSLSRMPRARDTYYYRLPAAAGEQKCFARTDGRGLRTTHPPGSPTSLYAPCLEEESCVCAAKQADAPIYDFIFIATAKRTRNHPIDLR